MKDATYRTGEELTNPQGKVKDRLFVIKKISLLFTTVTMTTYVFVFLLKKNMHTENITIKQRR